MVSFLYLTGDAMKGFARELATTVCRDRLSVMVECDHNDDKGLAVEQSALTRLHDRIHGGERLSKDDLAMVRTLSEKLGIKDTKTLNLLAGARTGFRALRQQIILSRPLGPYYTKISLDYSVYHHDNAEQIWDEQPIEFAELSMIPACGADLETHRLSRCIGVSFQFDTNGFNPILKLMTEMVLFCTTLELRNPGITPQQLGVLKMRLAGKWPNLQHVVRGQ